LTVLDHVYNDEVIPLLGSGFMFASIGVGMIEMISGVLAIMFFKKLSKEAK